jgi:hypothetical protein
LELNDILYKIFGQTDYLLRIFEVCKSFCLLKLKSISNYKLWTHGTTLLDDTVHCGIEEGYQILSENEQPGLEDTGSI